MSKIFHLKILSILLVFHSPVSINEPEIAPISQMDLSEFHLFKEFFTNANEKWETSHQREDRQENQVRHKLIITKESRWLYFHHKAVFLMSSLLISYANYNLPWKFILITVKYLFPLNMYTIIDSKFRKS